MIHNRTLPFSLIFFLGLCNPSQATEDQFQQWTGINLKYAFNDTYRVNLSTQARISTDASTSDLFLLRPSVHMRLSPYWSVGLGYDYFDKSRSANEQRVWQEIIFSHYFDDLKISNRIRIEERFLKNLKVIARGRYSLRGQYPLGDSRWHGIGSNEVMVNFNSHGVGPIGGFEENRLFAGFKIPVNTRIRVESGYQWRYVRSRTGSSENDHTLIINLFFQ